MLDQALVDSLAQVLGHNSVSTQKCDLDRYSTDALAPSRAFRAAPTLEKKADVVVFPHSVQQVSKVVKLALAHQVPIVPYGGGTGVMGGAFAAQGGIVIDLKGLDRILEVNPADRTVWVEAGVILEALAQALETHGLMLGHDPWSRPIATVGGAISTDGVGYTASSYGPMGDQVLGLEVVLPSGEVLKTRSVPKYSSGPNLNHLFIGSEGVFGIITKAMLQVFRMPEERSFATIEFGTFDDGFKAVGELFSLGVRPTLVDLSEEYGQGVQLCMMFEGYREGVMASHGRAVQVCLESGGNDLGPEDAKEHWQTRHQSGEWYRKEMLDQPRDVRWRRSGRGALDYLHVALPISCVLEYRRRCDELLLAKGLRAAEYSIWTRPELFSILVVPSGNTSDVSRDGLAEAVDQVLTMAQDMGGTMEYCHGVGIKLAHLLPREMGEGYAVARALKRTLDPANIMNPGKLF